MDAVEFFKTVNRLCKNQRYCAECPIHKNGMGCIVKADDDSTKSIEETVSKVEQWAKDVKFCPSDKFVDEKGNWNNYRTSNVRGILSDMAKSVFGGKSLLSHTVDLVADRAYGTVQDDIFILACDEYRKYREFIPHYDSWTSTPWSCGDNDSDMGAAISVRFVDTDGQLDINYAYFSYAVVPACILNPEFLNLRKDMAYVEDVSE